MLHVLFGAVSPYPRRGCDSSLATRAGAWQGTPAMHVSRLWAGGGDSGDGGDGGSGGAGAGGGDGGSCTSGPAPVWQSFGQFAVRTCGRRRVGSTAASHLESALSFLAATQRRLKPAARVQQGSRGGRWARMQAAMQAARRTAGEALAREA